jgi:hypothetical protein
MNDSRGAGQPDRHGLCPRCANVKLITSAKGSTFLLCQLSASDPRFPRYPPQPVVACGGFVAAPRD